MSKALSVVVITMTPFDENGALDEAAYRKHLRRLRDAGVSVYVAGSASSEAYTLSPEERDRVLEISVEELKGRVPFRAMGCEPRVASEMISFMRAAERAKVDAAQIFSLDIGHGARPTNTELEKYYSEVIESTSLPIYLSSHHKAGYVLPLELVETLVGRFPQIAGIAYSGSNISYFASMIQRFGDRIEVHCAGAANAAASLVLGGNGFMGGEGNFVPELVQSIINAFKAKEIEKMGSAFDKLMRLIGILEPFGGASSMRALKPLMNAYGLSAGHLRPPRYPITDAQLREVIKQVSSLGLTELPELIWQ